MKLLTDGATAGRHREIGRGEDEIRDHYLLFDFLDGSDRPIEGRHRWVLARFGGKAVAVSRSARQRDGLRSRQIGTPCLITDGLDSSNQPSGADNHVKMTTHYLDGEDAADDDRPCRLRPSAWSRLADRLIAGKSSDGSHGWLPPIVVTIEHRIGAPAMH
ncbi:hypothetical protein ACLOJK_024286 [Asimina triloba]